MLGNSHMYVFVYFKTEKIVYVAQRFLNELKSTSEIENNQFWAKEVTNSKSLDTVG